MIESLNDEIVKNEEISKINKLLSNMGDGGNMT